MKKVKKAIIPAAGWGTRFLPMTKVVHKELVPVLNKPIIHYLAKEAADSGIEELILVIAPRKMEILKYFHVNKELEEELEAKGKIELLHKVQETNTLIKVTVAMQNEQLGLGHAIFMAADIVGDEPFAVILGDDLVKSNVPATKQLIEAYGKTGSSIIGVQQVEPRNVHKYGVVNPVGEKDGKLIEIDGAVEKPSKEKAPSNQAIYGRYLFTPELMPILRTLKPGVGNEINVVDGLKNLMALGQKIYAYEFEGTRYDLGSIEGFVKAQIDYALDDKDISEQIKKHINKIK